MSIAEQLEFELKRRSKLAIEAALFGLPQLGRDVFMRGMAEGVGVRIIYTMPPAVTVYDLLAGYAAAINRQSGARQAITNLVLD